MILYDGVSDVDFFYLGVRNPGDMAADRRLRPLVEVPCVLYDNGSGKVYRFEPLSDLASRLAVPQTTPESTFAACVDVMEGKYEAPGVSAAREKAETAQTTADEAQSKADEAKAIAEQAGTDPQLQALASMWVMTMDLSPMPSSDLATFRDYWPEWQTDHEYKKNDALRYNGLYYRVSQPHTSQAIYPPDTAGESMYYPVTIAPDGIIVYRECHGDYDMVTKGETRHSPDADGPVYRAKVDTAYDPSTVPDNWKIVE